MAFWLGQRLDSDNLNRNSSCGLVYITRTSLVEPSQADRRLMAARKKYEKMIPYTHPSKN